MIKVVIGIILGVLGLSALLWYIWTDGGTNFGP
jgi:hypothetical protein